MVVIEDRPIDLPWATRWHTVVVAVRRRQEVRYWFRFWALTYSVSGNELEISGEMEFVKTSSREKSTTRTGPERLKRRENLAFEYERKLIGYDAIAVDEEIINQGLSSDTLYDRSTVLCVVKPALDELMDIRDRLSSVILEGKWRPKVVSND